ncbi:MAG: asparagine synthase B [Alphaproteobacteria bacterium]|nr:asparagine synthase B [Alphaproteobacteria bacterium]
MCGIVAILEHRGLPDARGRVVRQAQALRHRGPDWSGAFSDARFAVAHERLAIVDPESGEQPLKSPDGRYVLAVNGEIYNHEDLRHTLAYPFQTHSDCEVILPLYASGEDFLDRLRGMFAFVLVDTVTGNWMIARDHMGIIPLYTGRDAQGRLWVSSEMKALVGVCTSVRTFPPGHVQTQADAEPVHWWTREWFEFEGVPEDRPRDPAALREALLDSVRCHLMSDVPYGVLLSGGLDSSVISAAAAKFAPERVEGGGAAWYPRLHSFSIGLQGSPDLAAAKIVADAIGTVHHGFTYTVEEGLDAVSEAIRHLETYDVTTIRAGTPMFLMARKIKAMGIKMVLSGEGSDEIFGGYLYFHKAPNAREFHEETVRKLHQLHLYDCNRANKAMAAWGVEARVPFLDTRFLDHAMRIPARQKMVGQRGIEKELLRTAFDGWLPDSVLWRQKEQFSDGVGYGWIDGLKARAERQVTDRQMAEAAERFPVGTPGTKEAYVYREIFDMHFPLPSAATTVPNQESVACSTSVALEWDEAFKKMADPSGRAVRGVHEDAY